jgi:peptide chain release factor
MNNYKKSDDMFIQITSGRGPAECCWVVAQLLKVLMNDLQSHQMKVEVLSKSDGQEPRTLSSVFLKISNVNREYLKEWEGSVQWIGTSPFRKFHKRKNWFVGVSILTTKEAVEWKIDELVFQTYRASGPGGQHRNKVESAVRVTHQPSGVTASSSESRSQHQNKKIALERLKSVFETHQIEIQKKQIEQQWASHLSLERGNPVKVFQGVDFIEK